MYLINVVLHRDLVLRELVKYLVDVCKYICLLFATPGLRTSKLLIKYPNQLTQEYYYFSYTSTKMCRSTQKKWCTYISLLLKQTGGVILFPSLLTPFTSSLFLVTKQTHTFLQGEELGYVSISRSVLKETDIAS